MRLAVLGPVVLAGDDGPVPVTPRKARELLTMLALEHPRPLSLEALASRLWDEPPPAAAKTVQAHLSRLRAALAAAGSTGAGIAGGPAGYRLDGAGELDVSAFQCLARAGRQHLLAETCLLALDALGSARALVRGTPELPATAAGEAQRTWLEELHLGVVEDHVEALILGDHVDTAIADLELLTAAHRLRERFWELRMVALARASRPAEALRTYVEVRELLAEEIGIEPGDGLRALEQEILAGRVPTCARPRPAAADRPASHSAPAHAADDDQEPVPVRYLEVDDIHLAYCTVGSGPCDLVVMIPSMLPVDAVVEERRLARSVRALATFARVTWFNPRGVGLSDRVTADRLPSVQDWVDDLDAVLRHLGATHQIVMASDDTTAVALRLAAADPERLAGIVLTNSYARFTRGNGYPHGLDPLFAEQGMLQSTAPDGPSPGFDLLTMIAPSMADDVRFRSWWNDGGRRGATPKVARALRHRHDNEDLRPILASVTTPVLHLVNPTAPAHDRGHDRYLEVQLPAIETRELPGPDELWWLDESGLLLEHVERFVRERTAGEGGSRSSSRPSACAHPGRRSIS